MGESSGTGTTRNGRDVFGRRFTKDEHRLFKKLRKDMLK